MIETVTRNASLQDLSVLLQQQHGRKIDVVAPAAAMRLEEGGLVLNDVPPVLEDDGVTDPNGLYIPTSVFDEGLADKFGVPLAYVRRLRAERPDLLDANANGWMHGRKAKIRRRTNPAWQEFMQAAGPRPTSQKPEQWIEETVRPAVPGDPRSFLLRLFRGDEPGEPGIARALLSDRYQVVDHLDALTAALDGVRSAGVEVEIASCDLTERRMVVKVKAPQVEVLAPTLLKGYRSPWNGREADENPVVFAGFRIANSETGDGAFSLTPEITVKVCDNGLLLTKQAMRQVHLGGRLEEGLVRWSTSTQKQAIELVKAKTTDAVRSFLDVDFVRQCVEEIEADGVKPVERAEEVKVIAKRLSFSQEHIDGVFDFFVKGGQMTRMGVVNAITAYSQTVEHPDVAHDLESRAVRALEVSA